MWIAVELGAVRHLGAFGFIILLSNGLGIISPVVGSQGSDYISSYGRITHPHTRAGIYRGFASFGQEWWDGSWEVGYFQELKSLGFNALMPTFWWAQIENRDGTYQEARLAAIQKTITMAKNAGLEVIVGWRVSYEDGVADKSWQWGSTGYPTHDYVNRNLQWGGEYGRTRYLDFLDAMSSRFPQIVHIPWQCPYHREGPSDTDRSVFYSTTMPEMIQTIRNNIPDSPIVFVPIHQGLLGVEAGYYHDAEPLDDTNVIYGFGHMSPGKVEYDRNTWNYDMSQVDEVFEGIKIFRETYDAPMMSVEYFPLEWSGSIDQSRLDALEESLRRMKTYDAGWMYWRISIKHIGANDVLDPNYDFEIQHDLLSLLQGAIT